MSCSDQRPLLLELEQSENKISIIKKAPYKPCPDHKNIFLSFLKQLVQSTARFFTNFLTPLDTKIKYFL